MASGAAGGSGHMKVLRPEELATALRDTAAIFEGDVANAFDELADKLDPPVIETS